MAMMSLCHLTNNKFNLFHLINQHWIKKCHVLMVLKSAKSLARAMIVGMLPYLQWKYDPDEKRKAKLQSGSSQQPKQEQRMCIGIQLKNASRIPATKC